MSKEKQIEEIAKVICENIDRVDKLAEHLHNAGYRKQSDGEWLIENFNMPFMSLGSMFTCSCCGYNERRGPAWNTSWGIYEFCPNCGAKMKGGAE